MALYAPQQQFQAPAVIAQNNFHHAHNNTNFSSASNQFAQNSRGQVTSSEPTTTKSTEPSDECFTIDFSNLSGDSISFSKWNGMNAVPLKPDIQPAIFGLGSGNTEQGLVDNFDNIKIPLKDFTNIYDGSEAQSKCSEKFKFLPIQMILLSLVTNDIKSRESDIKAMATFIQYTHNKYMSTSENHKKNPVKGSKGGKVKSVGRSVTFVIPVDIPLSGRQLLVDAAKLAGFTVRNIFTPDVALIAHMYSELSPGQLLFESSNDVHVLSIVNNAVSKSFTLSLFTCEINPSTYSMERICPIASVSGGIGSKLVSDLCKKANIATVRVA